MVDTQHFCLRWNNYQSSITSAFENLRDDEDFVDVTLACDGKSLKAHRVVLSACSPYFRELLKSTPCKHPVIVLQDVAFTDLHALVEFIYHGEVNVHQRSLSSFLKTAEVLRVSGLTQQHGEDRDITQVQQQTNSRFGISNQQTQSPHTLNNDEVSSPGNNGNPVRRPSATRRERRGSTEQQISENELKRSRHDHNLNNNMPEQLTPTDFSPTAMKNTVNSVLQKHDGQSDGHGNGMESPSRSPPPSVGIQRPNNNDDDNVKHEPMDASLDLDNNSNDSTGGGTLKKGPPSSCSAGDHDDHDSPLHPAFLTPSESKLFATAAGSFNFSMAALAGDPTGLAGLGSQALQNTADNLAGTSQGGFAASFFNSYPTDLQSDSFGTSTMCTPAQNVPSMSGMCSMQTQMGTCSDMEIAAQNGEQCQICGKWLRNKITLKRHVQDLHCLQTEEYWCRICNKMYRTRNSLVVHMCNYHQKKKDPTIYPNIPQV